MKYLAIIFSLAVLTSVSYYVMPAQALCPEDDPYCCTEDQQPFCGLVRTDDFVITEEGFLDLSKLNWKVFEEKQYCAFGQENCPICPICENHLDLLIVQAAATNEFRNLQILEKTDSLEERIASLEQSVEGAVIIDGELAKGIGTEWDPTVAGGFVIVDAKELAGGFVWTEGMIAGVYGLLAITAVGASIAAIRSGRRGN